MFHYMRSCRLDDKEFQLAVLSFSIILGCEQILIIDGENKH